MDTTAVLATSSAVISAIAAAGSWWAARQANRASGTMAQIERDRWHAHLTPEIFAELRDGQNDDRAELFLRLDGPVGLDLLDEVTVTVRDDRPDRSRVGELAGQVWGPYRIMFGGGATSRDGRQAVPFPLARGDSKLISVERTRPVQPTTDLEVWRREYAGPLRLTFTCRRGGERTWTVLAEVDAPGSGAS